MCKGNVKILFDDDIFRYNLLKHHFFFYGISIKFVLKLMQQNFKNTSKLHTADFQFNKVTQFYGGFSCFLLCYFHHFSFPLRFQENNGEVFRRRTYKVSPVSYDVKKIVKNCVLVPKQSPPAVLWQVGTNTGKGGTAHICEHRTLQVPPTLFFFLFPTSSNRLVCKRSGVGAG